MDGGIDLFDLAMAGFLLLSLGIAIVVIAWPLDSERARRREAAQ